MKDQIITGHVDIGDETPGIVVGYIPHETDPRVTFEDSGMIPLTALTIAEARIFANSILFAVHELESEDTND